MLGGVPAAPDVRLNGETTGAVLAAPVVHLTGETAIGARTPGAIAATFGAKATSKKAVNIKPSDATQKPAFERMLTVPKLASLVPASRRRFIQTRGVEAADA